MNRAGHSIWILFVLTIGWLSAGASSAERLGMDPAGLGEIAPRMQRFVEERQIAGAVTLVARRGEVVSLEAIGFSDLASGRKMKTDDLFWIASMTKPITAVAVLMLQDEGRLSVEDPVAKHLPEFKDQWLVQARNGTAMSLTRPARAVTIRDLLTHTSGLGDLPAPRSDCSLAELVVGYSQQPLKFQPGTRWEYSNPGINTLGRIVEVVSGDRFEQFLKRRIFRPLGMRDTTFWPTEAQLPRVAKSYQPGRDGMGLEPSEIFFIKGGLTNRKRTPFPAGGLFSTAQDMEKFYRMMLGGGEFRGRRLLSREAVDQLTRTQTGELRTGFVDGMGFGFGFAVVKQPQGVTRMLSAGSFGHGGAYGTQSWADPERGLVMILMIQRARLPNADASPMREALQEMAVGAIRD